MHRTASSGHGSSSGSGLSVMNEAKGFASLGEVRGWLQQFFKPEVVQSLDAVSIQMFAVLARAVDRISAEVEDLKCDGGQEPAAAGKSAKT